MSFANALFLARNPNNLRHGKQLLSRVPYCHRLHLMYEVKEQRVLHLNQDVDIILKIAVLKQP